MLNLLEGTNDYEFVIDVSPSFSSFNNSQNCAMFQGSLDI